MQSWFNRLKRSFTLKYARIDYQIIDLLGICRYSYLTDIELIMKLSLPFSSTTTLSNAHNALTRLLFMAFTTQHRAEQSQFP